MGFVDIPEPCCGTCSHTEEVQGDQDYIYCTKYSVRKHYRRSCHLWLITDYEEFFKEEGEK